MLTKSQDMVETYKITNIRLLIKCAVVFTMTLILFFLNPFVDVIYLTIGWISILSALVLLTAVSETPEETSRDACSESTESFIPVSSKETHMNIGFEAIMHKVEWSKISIKVI